MEFAFINKNNIFHRYVLPDAPKATAFAGLHVTSGQLFLLTLKPVFCDFVVWRQSFHNPILVCHNGKCFDSIIHLLVEAF